MNAIVHCLPGAKNPVQGGRRDIIAATVMGYLAEFQSDRNRYSLSFRVVCRLMKPANTDITSKQNASANAVQNNF